jgi:4-hydroxybenzoate polyprenyltransferase
MKKDKQLKVNLISLFLVLLGAYTFRSAYLKHDIWLYVIGAALFIAAYLIVKKYQVVRKK